MSYLRLAEELLDSLSDKHLRDTLSNIFNDDFYEKDFESTFASLGFLYMLEVYDLAFVANTNRVLLTPNGEKLLIKLNSLLL